MQTTTENKGAKAKGVETAKVETAKGERSYRLRFVGATDPKQTILVEALRTGKGAYRVSVRYAHGETKLTGMRSTFVEFEKAKAQVDKVAAEIDAKGGFSRKQAKARTVADAFGSVDALLNTAAVAAKPAAKPAKK